MNGARVPRLCRAGIGPDLDAGRCRHHGESAGAQGRRRPRRDQAGRATLLFLPPYSPDFTPIENAFSKLKAMLRTKAERTINALWNTVGAMIDQFSPRECTNYFSTAGYEPD